MASCQRTSRVKIDLLSKNRTERKGLPMEILVAVDVSKTKGDELSQLAQLDRLVGLKNSDVTLLYAQEALPSFEAVLRTQDNQAIDLEKEVEEAAARELEGYAESLRQAGATVAVEIVHGPPAYMIEQVAKDKKSDLLVVTAGKDSDTFLIGSTSQHVVRHAPASVLVLRTGKSGAADVAAPSNSLPVSKILVAVDGSEACLKAVTRAVDALNLDKSLLTINIVHVVVLSPMIASFTPQSFATLLEENMLMEGEAALANAQKAFSDKGYKSIEIELGKGNAANDLIKMQNKYQSDLIVIGSQGKGAVKHFLMGHVANRIVTHASAPTIVAR
jgi:nucleotide-binding universal stress UspA family protein